MKFSIATAPTKLDQIDKILNCAADFLSKLVESEAKLEQQLESNDIINNDTEYEITKLLTEPLRLASVQILSMDNFPRVMKFINWEARKDVAAEILRSILGSRANISDPYFLDRLFTFISPLIHDDPDTPTDEGDNIPNSRRFEESQNLVAKLVHCIYHTETNQYFALLNIARKHFNKGGKKRIRYTLAPLCFGYFNLVKNMSASKENNTDNDKKDTDDNNQKSVDNDDEDIAAMLRSNALSSSNKTEEDEDGSQGAITCRFVLKTIHEIIAALLGVEENHALGLSLYLNAATIADLAKEESAAYEFMAQSFTLYEDISNTSNQMNTLHLMIGTLQVMKGFSKENYNILCTKTVQYAGSMLKKQDQAKMLLQCIHLFSGMDDKKNCLQKSLKCAQASPNHIGLYIDILNRYLMLFSGNGSDGSIKPQSISGLISVIQEEITAMKGKNTKTIEEENAYYYFDATIDMVKKDSRYSEIKDLLVA